MTSNHAKYRQSQQGEKFPQLAEQMLEVVRRARQHRVGGVAGHAFEIIAYHSEVMFEMANRSFNPSAATEAMLSDLSFMGRRLPRWTSWHMNFRRPTWACRDAR